jgi:hypothetical protein
VGPANGAAAKICDDERHTDHIRVSMRMRWERFAREAAKSSSFDATGGASNLWRCVVLSRKFEFECSISAHY